MKKEKFRRSILSITIMLMASATHAEMGTFDSNQRQYLPRSCELNGTDAVCTFAVVNRGPAATIYAWSGSDLPYIQFIDNAKAPHDPKDGYFLDKFGGRHTSFVLSNGEQGWYVIEFASVDARVTSGSFKFNNRVIGEVAVTPYVPPAVTSAPPARAASAAPAAAPPAAPQVAPAPVQVATPPTQTPVPSPEAAAPAKGCPPNDKACKAAEKMEKVQSTTENTAKAMDNTAKAVDNTTKAVDTAKGLFKSLGGLFGKSDPPPQPQQAPPQQTQTQPQ